MTVHFAPFPRGKSIWERGRGVRLGAHLLVLATPDLAIFFERSLGKDLDSLLRILCFFAAVDHNYLFRY